MKIISFNTNSIRARFHQLEALIASHQPDVIGIQETKVTDDQFPIETIKAMGYHVFFHGQKSHYGVAMMSKVEPVNVIKGFAGDDEQSQRRMITADFKTRDDEIIRVFNGYFPQGESRDHPLKFPAKEKFYQDLNDFISTDCRTQKYLAVIGDFNVAPLDIDIGIGAANAKRWLKDGKTSFLPEEREWLEGIANLGLVDTYRKNHADVDDVFSWFDYRSKGFDKEPKRGLRIDLVMANQALTNTLQATGIDYDIRAMEKPSDHCPVWSEFDIAIV